MKNNAWLTVVLLLLFQTPTSKAVECFIGSEAAVMTTDIHYRQCDYACGIFERLFDNNTQLYDLNEFYFDCLPQSLDSEGICKNLKESPATLQQQSSLEELSAHAPETDWNSAWKVATGTIGSIQCCNLPVKKGLPNGCEPTSFHRGPARCLAYHDRPNKLHIWRISTIDDMTRACEAVMFFRNGRVYRKNGPSSTGLCPADNHCQEISNADFIENVLRYSLSEEDRQLHPTDSAIVCCVNIGKYNSYRVPDDPYERFQCKVEGSDEIVHYQRGSKVVSIKPRPKYNDYGEFESNVNRFKDEL